MRLATLFLHHIRPVLEITLIRAVVPACSQNLLEHVKPPVARRVVSHAYSICKLEFLEQPLRALEQLEEKVYELVQLRIYLKLPDLHAWQLVEETVYGNWLHRIVVI